MYIKRKKIYTPPIIEVEDCFDEDLMDYFYAGSKVIQDDPENITIDDTVIEEGAGSRHSKDGSGFNWSTDGSGGWDL